MSEETKPDVEATESSTEQPVTEQPVENPTEEQTATPETTEQAQEESQEATPTAQEQETPTPINAELYDERGVPWKNVALENRRKFEETQSNLPKLVAEEVAKVQQPQQKQYTVGELEKFAQENPEHRPWVEEEKAKVLKQEIAQEMEAKVQAQTKTQQDEFIRKQTFDSVLKQFPDMAVRDQQGNFVGWNNMNPMTQAVGKYMSSKDIADRPDGLIVASKLAFADLAFQKAPQTAKKMKSVKSQLRKVQAQTFVEGSGRKPRPVSPTAKHHERLRSTGSREDGAAVMREVFKAKGVIKE